jgi:hypothetical protein
MLKPGLLVKGQLVMWLCFASLTSPGLAAQTLSKPKGPVILTVSGQIDQRNVGDLAEFDAEMLDALPAAHFTTATPWHKIPVRFSGPALKTVLAAAGARGRVLRMIAMDKYEVSVPFDDAARFLPLLARRADGTELKIRTQGPVFMIYPFDTQPLLKSDTYYGRSIWQLQRIVVE